MMVKSPFRVAALFLLLSAVLHLVVIAVSGGGFLMPMIVGAIMWFVIGAGLQRGLRWLAYVAFLLAMIGGVYAMGVGMGQTGLTQMALFGIMVFTLALINFVNRTVSRRKGHCHAFKDITFCWNIFTVGGCEFECANLRGQLHC